ncbi:DUF1404 domain-containing protein [Metallosphaera tengchongensis]|uniref:DUF1404 domain-containing protein n=1 Tax=Metallosphaera tengchongensis TaxID=1532350 RepID=A0A6N0NXF5_9CREN|nr:DUF1404 domain-containing protein [Metallosphaera tengchongensis]QKR00895.1 DUF1404 domain-containing protein [Metallosphaera tengchongensis]
MISYVGEVKKSPTNLVVSLLLIALFVNPLVESLQSVNPIVFMLDHYAMFLSGSLLGYRYFKGSVLTFSLGSFLAVFWHVPLFFDLAGSYISYRLICEATLVLGGVLAGSYIPRMNLTTKVTSLALYMLGDSLLSIFFILGYPQYSSQDFPLLSWGPSQLPAVGITMFVVMNLVLIYAIFKLMKNISLI